MFNQFTNESSMSPGDLRRSFLDKSLMGLESHYGGGGNKGGDGGGGTNQNKKKKKERPKYHPKTARYKKEQSKLASQGIGTSVQAAYNAGERGWAVGKDSTSYSGGNIGDASSPAAKSYKAAHGEAAYSKMVADKGYKTSKSSGYTTSSQNKDKALATFTKELNLQDLSKETAQYKNLFATTIKSPISSWYNQGRLPGESKMSFGDLAKNDWSQRQFTQGPAKGAWNPFRGMPGYGTVKNIVTGKPWNTPHEGGFTTGPTPAVRQFAERVVPGVYMGTKLFSEGQTGSLTDQFAQGVFGNLPQAGTAHDGTWSHLDAATKAFEGEGKWKIGDWSVPDLGVSEYLGLPSKKQITDSINPLNQLSKLDTKDYMNIAKSPVTGWGLSAWDKVSELPGDQGDEQVDSFIRQRDALMKLDKEFTEKVQEGSPYKRGLFNMFPGIPDTSISEEIQQYKDKAIEKYGEDSAQAAFWSKPQNEKAWNQKVMDTRMKKYFAFDVLGRKDIEGDEFRQGLGDILGTTEKANEFINRIKEEGISFDTINQTKDFWKALGDKNEPIPYRGTEGWSGIENLIASGFVGDALSMAAIDKYNETGEIDTISTLINLSQGEPKAKIDQILKLAGYYEKTKQLIANPVEGLKKTLGFDPDEIQRRRDAQLSGSGSNTGGGFQDINSIIKQYQQESSAQEQYDISQIWAGQTERDALYQQGLKDIASDQSLYTKELERITADQKIYQAELDRVKAESEQWGKDPEYQKYLAQVTGDVKGLSEYKTETTSSLDKLNTYLDTFRTSYTQDRQARTSAGIDYAQQWQSATRTPVMGIRSSRGFNVSKSPWDTFGRKGRTKSKDFTYKALNV